MLRSLLILILGTTFSFGQKLEWKKIPELKPIPSVTSNGSFNWSSYNLPDDPVARYADDFRSFEAMEIWTPEILRKYKLKEIQLSSDKEYIVGEWNYTDNAILDISVLSKRTIPSLNGMQAVAELPDGRIMFAGVDVFFIYDGYRLLEYQSNEFYQFGQITSILVDSSGKTWICTEYGIYCYWNNRFFFLENIDFGKVWEIWEDDDKSLWVGTSKNGMFHLEKDRTEHFYHKDYLVEVFDFEKGNDNAFYIVETNNLFRIKNGLGRIRADNKMLFRCIEKEGDRFIIGTFLDGIYELKKNQLRHIDLPVNGYSIYNMAVTGNGLWIPSYGKGVLFLGHDNAYQLYTEKEGLLGKNALKLMSDSYGNVWVCDLISGISRISESNLVLYETPKFEDADKIYSTGDQEYYVLKANRDFLRIRRNVSERLNFNDGSAVFQTPVIDRHKNIYVGMFEYGIYQFEANTSKYNTYRTEEHSYAYYVITSCLDDKSNFWYTNYNKELRVLKDDVFYNLSSVSPFSDYKAKKVVSYDRGQLVILDKGIALIEEGKYCLLDKSSGLSSNEILGVYSSLASNEIWVFTDTGIDLITEKGLLKSIKTTIPFELGELSVQQIDKDKFFLNGRYGSTEIRIKGDQVIEKLRTRITGAYSVNLRLISTDYPVILTNQNTTLLYQPEWIKRPQKKGVITLNEIFQTGKVTKSYRDFTQNEPLHFEFTVINFAKRSECVYRIIEIGAENSENWISFSGNGLIMDKLPAASYKLETCVINEFGRGPVTTVEFKILPYWYERWEVKIFAILLIGGLLIVFIKRRLSKEVRKRRRLQLIVQGKTEELKNEKLQVEHELAQKEILLKEVNHRVKNNMQMVSSVLELQRSKTDEKNKSTLDTAINRIKALGFAHQYLYKNEQYEQIQLSEYIELITSSVLMHTGVKSTVQIPTELMLNIEEAQALGVVINELLSNSIKHAWPTSGNREMWLVMEIQNGEIKLVYRDNGVGLGDNSDQKDTLGMQLVDSFIKRRLQGSYQITYNSGYQITINFKSK